VLLQHSLGFSQRHAAHVDAEIYQRANLRTPSQNAFRDSLGSAWLECLVDLYRASATNLVWVETNQTVEISTGGNVSVVSVANNPFGWNGTEGSTLENLDTLLAEILVSASQKSSTVTPIIFESITPILIRHGLQRTMHFLRELATQLKSTIVIPVLVESLSGPQHRALEDMAQATLYLHGGDMTLIRQGVRERGNVVREIVLFQVDHLSSGKPVIRLHHIECTNAQNVSTTIASNAVLPALYESTISRSGKVKLHMEDNNHADMANIGPGPSSETIAAKQPTIFIQDDDPEYDDLDEDDPDDDLYI
jgi:hypothetical protein